MTSIKKQIVVETSQQRAFRTFTDGIDRWWPREHHIGQSPLERMIVEPRTGDRWYSIRSSSTRSSRAGRSRTGTRCCSDRRGGR